MNSGVEKITDPDEAYESLITASVSLTLKCHNVLHL